jgi:two-component system sensor histidine kinase KdpD
VNREEESRPDPRELLRQLGEGVRRRAVLRVYLEYATGCGGTWAMLDEARRRAERGTDVVVAAYRLHHDPEEALHGLEVLGGRGAGRERSLDLDRLLARNPTVVCVDDLSAVDTRGGSLQAAVQELLRAGITVLATMHLLSIRDFAAALREAARWPASRPLVDDAVITEIDELELVDLPPQDLIERIRGRGVLAPADLARALQGELRPQLLPTLREAAFRLISQHADRDLDLHLQESGVSSSAWEPRGPVVLCLPIARGLEERIRWASVHAASRDAGFAVVTVRRGRLSDGEKTWMGRYATLTHQLGGDFQTLYGRDVASTLADYIRRTMATEVILGHRRHRRWRPWDTTSQLIRRLSGVDVHILRGAEPAPTA